MLPTDAQERKNIPVYSGFVCYFPDAIAEVAKVSKRGNDQHNPGKPLHWDRSKSSDELDSLFRHLIDGSNPDSDLDTLILEAAARTWRSLAHLQKLCEERADEADDDAELAAIVRARAPDLIIEYDEAGLKKRLHVKSVPGKLDPEWVAKVSREEEGPCTVGTENSKSQKGAQREVGEDIISYLDRTETHKEPQCES